MSETRDIPVDARGIGTRNLPGPARSTLKAQRLRGSVHPPQAQPISTWPTEWRSLAISWLKGQATRQRWTTLLGQAGPAAVETADRLRDALLELGWIEIDERRERGLWRPAFITWRDSDGLRAALGLPRRDALAARLVALLASAPADPRLHALHAGLSSHRASTATIARAELLQALDAWIAAGRDGTRRDFALQARDDTKAIGDAEWRWLEAGLDDEGGLEAVGISRHLPALWLRAPLSLHLSDARLDLSAVPDAIALTPSTIAAISRIDGHIDRWRIVENRTSFERAARRHGEHDGVLWLPGFAPGWWRTAVAHLLHHRPAPALLACDPDPAGVEIALGVGALWDVAGHAWQPWSMAATDLAALPVHKPLTKYDRDRLDALAARPLPPILASLVAAMIEHGHKGEQEGLPLE
jgi:hypothetical protein